MKDLQSKKIAEGKFERTALSLMFILIFFLIAGMLFSGCEYGAVDPASNENVSLSAVIPQSDNASITISEAKVLLKKIQFKQSASNDMGDVVAGPVVVKLNTSGTITVFGSGNIPAGQYDRIKFVIHKVEDNETPPDPEFKEGTSGNQRYSVIVKGAYNGSNFVYKSRKSVSHEIQFSTPVTFSADTKANLTLTVDIQGWFNSAGGVLDPSNSSNENLIDDNIKASFRNIFLDNDKNGSPDGN
jgi:hypothetical protein